MFLLDGALCRSTQTTMTRIAYLWTSNKSFWKPKSFTTPQGDARAAELVLLCLAR